MGKTSFAYSSALQSVLALACILLAASLLLTACPGDNPQPVSQPPVSAKPAGAKPPRTGAKAADTKATPAPGAPNAAGGDAAAAAEPIGPKVEVTDLLVDAPGVDFTGPGRYNITASTLLSEPWKTGVWDIIAYGEDGKKVGKQSMLLSMSHAKAKTLIFNDFYCSSIPVKIEILWTEKKADRSGEAGAPEDSGGGGGKKPGSGAAKPDAGGGGSKPPGKAPGGGGGAPKPPPSDDNGGGVDDDFGE